MIDFDHRASIVAYIEQMAAQHRRLGHETATDFDALASTIKAGLDLPTPPAEPIIGAVE